MSQNSVVLPTTGVVSGLQMTQNTNSALDTLNTLASGPSAPGAPVAGQLWHDTTNNILKIRSLDNTTWIAFLALNESSYAATFANLTSLALVTPTRTTVPTVNTASSQLADMNAVQQSQLGGFVNKFRNGTMDIAQRGTSGTITTGNSAYTIDGWVVGSTGATVSWSQQFSGVTNSSNLVLVGNSSMTDNYIRQRIESSLCYALVGQQVTVQANIYNNTGAAITPTLTIKRAGSFDNWTSPVTDVSAVSLQSCANNTYSTIAYTFACNALAYNGLEVTFDFGAVLSSNTKSLFFSLADIRPTPGVTTGLNSAPPIFERRHFQAELSLCQRYFEHSFQPGVTPAQNAGTAGAFVGGIRVGGIPFKTTKRATPTMTGYNPAAANSNARDMVVSVDYANTGFETIGVSSFSAYGDGNVSTALGRPFVLHWTALAEL